MRNFVKITKRSNRSFREDLEVQGRKERKVKRDRSHKRNWEA